MESKMTQTVTIDDIEYDLDKLSGEAKNQLVSLQYVGQELQKLNAQAAVLQTARVAYANALKDELPKEKKKKGLVFN
jgi:phage host-nuclease inhibitor protein Gam